MAATSLGPGKIAAALALATAASAWPVPADAAPVAPIIGGADDDGDLGVVGLVFDGAIACSGTLVAPRVVLTAAHCVRSRAPESVFFGPSIAIGGSETGVADVRVHPAFDPDTFEHDLALVLLVAPAPPGAEPWPLVAAALDDTWLGRTVRIVGFGTSDGTPQTQGRKREGTATIDAVLATSFRIAAGPARTCSGDSGGPAFVDVGGVEHLAGVTSSGDPACLLDAVEARVDLDAVAFVRAYIDETAPGAAALGDRCFYDEHCATARCAAPRAPPAFRYCSRACAGDGDCAAGMTCDGECRWPAPEPGAAGAPCDDATDCAVSECARTTTDEPRVCALRCFPENAMPCPAGLTCETNADVPTRSACFASDDGGCCSAAAGTPPLFPLLLAAAGLLARRRGRGSDARRGRGPDARHGHGSDVRGVLRGLR